MQNSCPTKHLNTELCSGDFHFLSSWEWSEATDSLKIVRWVDMPRWLTMSSLYAEVVKSKNATSNYHLVTKMCIFQGKMNVVNTLLAVARSAKECGMAADIDAPPKIANAFKGLEEKFGKKFEHTATVSINLINHVWSLDELNFSCKILSASGIIQWYYNEIC